MSDIPEQIEVVAATNGPQGGDSGHGGQTSICFSSQGSGSNTVTVKTKDGRVFIFESEDWETVTIDSCGDWEGCGLFMGLRDAFKKLESKWKDYAKS